MANDFVGPGDFASDAGESSASTGTSAWIAPDKDAPSGCGRIMLTLNGAATGGSDPVAEVPVGFSFLKKMLGILSPDSPQVSGNIAIKAKSAANDNAVWVGDDDNDGDGGVYGSDVDATTLADGSSVVGWIGPDRTVHAKYYPAEGDGQGASAEELAARAAHTGKINALLSDLGDAGQRADNADGRVKLTSYGQNGFAALWVADFGFTAALMGKLYLLQHDPLGETDATSRPDQSLSWTVKEIAPTAVPRHASNIAINVSDDGQITVTYRTEAGDGGATDSVTVAIADASGEAGNSDLRGSDEGDLLSPQTEASGFEAPHGSSAPVTSRNVTADGSDGEDASDEESTSADDAAGGVQVAADKQDGATIDAPLVDVSPDVLGEFEITGTPVTVAGGDGDAVQQTQPKVIVNASGNPVVMHVEAGAEPGTAVIKITALGSDGQPVTDASGSPVVTVVSDHAVVAVDDKPNLELDPTMAAVGEGVGIAFVTESSEGDNAVYQLNVQVLDGQGSAISDTPAVVALAADQETTYSDFSVGGVGGYSGGGGDQANNAADGEAQGTPVAAGTSDAGNEGGSSVQLAVVWVENANESGYGTIMGQRFGVTASEANKSENAESSGSDGNSGSSGEGSSGFVLVALGRDGAADGDGGNGDSAFQMPSETAEDVMGRAPQVSGCGDDGIAVAWVQETSAGSGVEVIAGAVLQANGGNSLLAINLTGLISNGVLAGTEPSLLASDNGDIVIGWVQGSEGGQYEAAVAVYRTLATGGWTVPETAYILRTFDSAPRNLDFGLQGGGDPNILLSWSGSGSRVSGAYFDLDGNQEGSVFRIRGDDDSIGGNEGDVSVAGLSDGHIVVVFTQADGGDTDIGAMVVQTAPDSSGEPSGANDSSLSPSEPSVVAVTSMLAIVVTAPADTDNSGSDAENCGCACVSEGSVDSGAATSLVLVDLESDLIRVLDNVAISQSQLTADIDGSSGSGSETAMTDSGSTNSGSGKCDEALVADDGDNSGSGSSGKNSSGSGQDGDNDNLAFAVGYGNDVKDYYDDDHEFQADDPVADMFDALQFANALGDNGNGEVLVFEASNLVVIRDFETL